MTDTNEEELGLLAKLVIALAILLIVAGVLWHGITVGAFKRLWHNLGRRADRPDEVPLHSAAVDGCDCRDPRWSQGRADWPLSVFLDRAAQTAGARCAVARGTKRHCQDLPSRDCDGRNLSGHCAEEVLPVEALIIALMLAFVPYLLIRGPVARIARRVTPDRIS